MTAYCPNTIYVHCAKCMRETPHSIKMSGRPGRCDCCGDDYRPERQGKLVPPRQAEGRTA